MVVYEETANYPIIRDYNDAVSLLEGERQSKLEDRTKGKKLNTITNVKQKTEKMCDGRNHNNARTVLQPFFFILTNYIVNNIKGKQKSDWEIFIV